jgi:DNA polymerase III subunit gamma/tau
MSYLVLARKYRSRDFLSLVGQEHVVQALSNALSSKRLHHAYLFTGTRGVGKTSVSRILAKALNCTGPDGLGDITSQPCGQCSACVEIDSGRFVDYVELDAASNRGVDEISQLLDQAVYKPVLGRFKVYMIDEVHMLSTTAFNAMLKTLEEPPEYLKFVLATTDPQKVPPTVLSRCLQFNLRPMAPATVQSHLATVLESEQIAFDPAALRLLARAAQGSMRDALSLTDQAIAYGAGALREVGVREMLGAVDRSHAVRMVDALAAGQGAALVAAVDDLRGLGLSAAATLEEMAALLQQMAVLQAVPSALDETDPEAQTVLRLAGLLPPDETQLLYSIVLHGRAELALAPDEYSGLVMVLLRMLVFRPAGAGARADGALARASSQSGVAGDQLQTQTQTQPLLAVRTEPLAALPACAPEPPPCSHEPPQAESLSASPHDPEAALAKGSSSDPLSAPIMLSSPLPTALGDRWEGVVQRLCAEGGITALVRELALQSECVAVTPASDAAPEVWQLRIAQSSLRSPAQRDKLQAALVALLGYAVQLEIDSSPAVDTPAQRASALRAQRQQQAERAIQSDPVVQSLMQQFKTARIVPGSIKFH